MNTKKSKIKKIDKLLQADAVNYTNLGIDSTITERRQVKKQSRQIYRAIKQLDYTLGESLLKAMDNEKNVS